MKRWLQYVKPYTLYFILGPICMLVEVAGEVFMPMFLGQMINAGVDGTLTVQKSILYMSLMILTALLMMVGGVAAPISAQKPPSTIRPMSAATYIRRCRNFPLPISISSRPVPWSRA